MDHHQYRGYPQRAHPQEFSESTASLFSVKDGNDGSQQPGGYAHPEQQQHQQQQPPSNGNVNGRGHVQGQGQGNQSMLDLANSVRELSEKSRQGSQPKKGPRVYKTAFGDFVWKDLLKRKFWKYYVGIILFAALIAVASHYHDDIVVWFEPIAEKIRDLPGGWAIFVGILFVISFPPLFGHELVCLICGMVYSIWIAFGIVALGTMLGEWGNFVVFKYACTARSRRMEEKDINFACIARVIREGGFQIAFVARLSAIPGHLTTPAFAATGMSLWVFTITALLTMPKQLMAVYLGTVFGDEKPPGVTAEKCFEWAVIGITFIITIWAAWYIYKRMAKVRPEVLAEREEKAIQAAAQLNGGIPSMPDAQPQPVLYQSGGVADSPERKQHQLGYQQRHSRPPSGGRWPFAARGEARLEEGQMEMEATSPLVSSSAQPAGYGEDGYMPPHNGIPGYLGGGSPYASSSEVDLQQGGYDAPPQHSHHPQDAFSQQPHYNEANYRRRVSQQQQQQQYQQHYPSEEVRVSDLRSQATRVLTPSNPPHSQQGEQEYASSSGDRSRQQQRQRHQQRAYKTASNTYYHSNPPPGNSHRYHSGDQQDYVQAQTQQRHNSGDHLSPVDGQSYPPSMAPPQYRTPSDEGRMALPDGGYYSTPGQHAMPTDPRHDLNSLAMPDYGNQQPYQRH